MTPSVAVTVQNPTTKEVRSGNVSLTAKDWELLDAAARIGNMTIEELLSHLLNAQFMLQFLAGIATRLGVPNADVEGVFARIVKECVLQVKTFPSRQ